MAAGWALHEKLYKRIFAIAKFPFLIEGGILQHFEKAVASFTKPSDAFNEVWHA
jgi:hypothetical protein